MASHRFDQSDASESANQSGQPDESDEYIHDEVALSVFSLPFPSWLQATSRRVEEYDQRKRKQIDLTDTEGDGGESTDAVSVTYVRSDSEPPVLTPNEAHQYQLAGLPFGEKLPKENRFPHGPPEGITEKIQLHETRREDKSQWSAPVYHPAISPYDRDDLHFQHLIVLNTVLHRCLLDGDFARASRAWGLLMREEFQSLPLDLHNAGRWGIGAEILLRRGAKPDLSYDRIDDDGRMSLPFTIWGTEEAKEYYERVILHHPYLRSAPRSISSLSLYPIMFGLWIYTIQEESNTARYNIEANDDSEEESDGEDYYDSDTETRRMDKKESLVLEVRTRELQQAQKIALRMDSIIGSPPYSDSPELLQMRGMVSLWISDLLISSSGLPLRPDDDMNDIEMDSPYDSYETLREQRLVLEKRRVEIEKSKGFFDRAKERTKGVAHTLENLHFEGSPPVIDLDPPVIDLVDTPMIDLVDSP